jgi:hypothetical protein
VKTSCTSNTCRQKEIEKTILRILGWCAFSHSLDPKEDISGSHCLLAGWLPKSDRPNLLLDASNVHAQPHVIPIRIGNVSA